MNNIFKKTLAAGAVAVLSFAFVAPAALACGPDKPVPAKTSPANADQIAIPIEGMTCDGCANRIQTALMGIDGVFVATVTHKSEKAVVQYDAAKVAPAALVEAIEAAGYKTGTPAPVVPARKS